MEQYFTKGVKRKQQPNPTNWQFAERKEAQAPETKLPSSVDISSKFPPIYTQVGGTCTIYSTIACDAYYYKEDNPSFVFTFHNAKALDHSLKDDSPVYVEIALDAIRKYGVCDASVWSNDKSFHEKPSKKAYENGLKGHEITKYYNTKTLLQIKKALAAGYPIAGAVAWAFKDYDENYVMNDVPKKEANKCELGHAIAIVGYDDDKQLVKFRNSWSTEWGDNGYGYITYKTFKNVCWFDDTYAIVK